MNLGVELLFTRALGFVPPWDVAEVKLDTDRRRMHQCLLECIEKFCRRRFAGFSQSHFIF